MLQHMCVCISACLLVCPALWPALPFGLDCSGLEYDKYSRSAKEHQPAPFELCLTPSSRTAGAYLTCNCIAVRADVAWEPEDVLTIHMRTRTHRRIEIKSEMLRT